MRSRFLLTSLCLAAAAFIPRPVVAAPVAPPPGAHVTRTMGLLAGSTPAHRNVVRIAVYGQSISKQEWSVRVRDELAERYPHAEIVWRNLASGGFAAPMLRRTMEHDLIPFYPDLVIFHAYGGDDDYEAVVRTIRTRTAAEVLVHNDHVTPGQKVAWHDKHSWQWMPALAERWGLELADARRVWVDTLAAETIPAEALLGADKSHLNARGNELLADVILSRLVHDPARPVDPRGLSRTFVVGRDARFVGQRLVLPFEGNRVDLVPARAGSADERVRVLIDGKPPSTFPELYVVSRPNADGNRDWPWDTGATIRVDHRTPLLLEDWTVRFTSVEPGGKRFAFDVFGSVTGPDGSGTSDAVFVSRSGRVVLEPGDWFIDRALARPQPAPIKVGYAVTWRIEPRFVDTWQAPAWLDETRENATTVAQGLTPGRHRLELVVDPGARRPPLAAIRVFRPPGEPAQR